MRYIVALALLHGLFRSPALGVASPFACVEFLVIVFVAIPMDAWLFAWPASVAHRDRITKPTYRHEV